MNLRSFASCWTFSDVCFPGGSVVKNLPASAGNAGDTGLTPGSGRSPGGGHGNPLQYSCLENPMDRGAWWATVHEVTKSQIQLSNWACSQAMLACMCSCSVASVMPWLFVTPWTIAHRVPLSTGFCRQEYWRGLPGPPPGAFPGLGIKPQLLQHLHCRQVLHPLSHLGSPNVSH